MQLPNPKDAVHKAWLYRILSGLCDDPELGRLLYFKGGTCAAMLGLLDRFSVDLDFDFSGRKKDFASARSRMEKVFQQLGLGIKDKSKSIPQYFLRYPAKKKERNTLKIDVTFPPVKANRYETRRFEEIDRMITCQTPDTMFANKMVALVDRFQQRSSIAGRDLYDIHYFFLAGLDYNKEVIRERTGKSVPEFFRQLTEFIKKHFTETIITQDLSTLLPYSKFRVIRKTLKLETLALFRDELERQTHRS
jgi:predicted nucleotidyltransferase component of viral defense system